MALDHEVVARSRLVVEVGRVGHGDGAGGGADGEHAVVVARCDRPCEACRVACGGHGDHGVAGGRVLGQVCRGVGHGRGDVEGIDGRSSRCRGSPSVARTTRS